MLDSDYMSFYVQLHIYIICSMVLDVNNVIITLISVFFFIYLFIFLHSVLIVLGLLSFSENLCWFLFSFLGCIGEQLRLMAAAARNSGFRILPGPGVAHGVCLRIKKPFQLKEPISLLGRPDERCA